MLNKTGKLFIFLLSLSIAMLAYLSYAIYCEMTIENNNEKVLEAKKIWQDYTSTTSKVNLLKAREISNLQNLPPYLLKTIPDPEKKTINAEENNLPDLPIPLKQAISESVTTDIDFITIFNQNNIPVIAVKQNDSNINTTQILELIEKSLQGKELSFKLSYSSKLYLVNLVPVKDNGAIVGVVMLAKEVNNAFVSHLQQLTGTNLIIASQNAIIASNLDYAVSKNVLKTIKNTYGNFMQLLNQEEAPNKVFYVSSNMTNIWASGEYLIKNSSVYLVIEIKSSLIWPYLMIKDNKWLAFLSAICIIGLITVFIVNAVNSLDIFVTEKTLILNKKVNHKIDNKIDQFFTRIMLFLKRDFFQTNKELAEVSTRITKLIREYKTTMLTDELCPKQPTIEACEHNAASQYSLETKNAGVYFSNLQEFTRLLEDTSPEKALTILSIYTEIQREIISKYHGRIIKQTDDKIMATFEGKKYCQNMIKAAWEIQKTLKNLTAVRTEDQIDLSIALSEGEINLAYFLDQMTYLGTPVKIASSLCMKTPPGDIYVDKAVVNKIEISTTDIKQGVMKVKSLNTSVSYYKYPSTVVQSLNIFDVKEKVKV